MKVYVLDNAMMEILRQFLSDGRTSFKVRPERTEMFSWYPVVVLYCCHIHEGEDEYYVKPSTGLQ